MEFLVGPVWSCIVLYGPVWSRMVPYGPVWSGIVPYHPVWEWSRMILYSPVLPCIISFFETVPYTNNHNRYWYIGIFQKIVIGISMIFISENR